MNGKRDGETWVREDCSSASNSTPLNAFSRLVPRRDTCSFYGMRLPVLRAHHRATRLIHGTSDSLFELSLFEGKSRNKRVSKHSNLIDSFDRKDRVESITNSRGTCVTNYRHELVNRSRLIMLVFFHVPCLHLESNRR